MKSATLTFLLELLVVAVVPKGPTAAAADNTYSRCANGPPKDAYYFPIGVWLQDPRNAERFMAAGFNLYVGLWKGPTEEQLAALRRAGMPVICGQNALGLAHKHDAIIVGWLHGDEPDNAQPVTDPETGRQTWGPCISPTTVVSAYERMKTADDTRPIMLNLGQGVANDEWYGRGNGAKLSDYETYVQGADIASFDVYPVAGLDKPDGENYLWYVAKGVDRLTAWTGGGKIIWNCIDCTRISGSRQATPQQVKAEVWMSLIHGSTGLIYFVHQFKPTFIEAALLADSDMLKAVTTINRQIQELAPVLNSPTIPGLATVESSAPAVPISCMVKHHAGTIYLFATGMRNAPATGRFRVAGLPAAARAEVLGENRVIPIVAGRFQDDFKPYDVHLYRVSAGLLK